MHGHLVNLLYTQANRGWTLSFLFRLLRFQLGCSVMQARSVDALPKGPCRSSECWCQGGYCCCSGSQAFSVFERSYGE